MPPETRVIDYVKEIGNYIETPEGTLTATQLLDKFLFPGDIQYSPISKLSGGEKRRLFLMAVLASAPNVLLLDEPTNDLDIHHAANLMKTVRRLCDELSKTVILVLHEIN